MIDVYGFCIGTIGVSAIGTFRGETGIISDLLELNTIPFELNKTESLDAKVLHTLIRALLIKKLYPLTLQFVWILVGG